MDRPPETNAIKIATVLPTTAIKKSEPVTLKLRLEEHVLETSIAQSVLTATVNQHSAKLYLPKELIVLLNQLCLECVDLEDFVLTIIAPDFSLYLMELIPLLLETTILAHYANPHILTSEFMAQMSLIASQDQRTYSMS